MAEDNAPCLMIRVLDEEGNFLGGKVDLQFRNNTLNQSTRERRPAHLPSDGRANHRRSARR